MRVSFRDDAETRAVQPSVSFGALAHWISSAKSLSSIVCLPYVDPSWTCHPHFWIPCS